MKIGMFGGTFNPVHIGHVNLARVCAGHAGLDKLLVIPTAIPPHKTSDEMPDDEHRMAMLEIAFEGLAAAEVSDLELKRGGRSYTIDTLHGLCGRYPDDRLYLIVGSDMYLTLESWHRAEAIKPLVTVLTMAREEGELERLQQEQVRLGAAGWCTEVCEEPPYVASSTAVRAGEMDLVPDAVADYIAQNGLYGCDADAYPWDYAGYEQMVRETLSERRFVHSVNVCEQAVHLAGLYGGSVPLCRVAGMLHDICKEAPRDRQLHLLAGSDRITNNLFLSQPHIWHGFAAAEYLRCALNITSRPILNAVRFHTTARADMSLTEMIVYLADLTSKERTYEGVAELRELCEQSLMDGMVYALGYFRDTLEVVCDETREAFDFYLE